MLVNLWLSARGIRRRFPLRSKVKVRWQDHEWDGSTGIVLGYSLFRQNQQYVMDIEVQMWSLLKGAVTVSFPHDRLSV